MISALEGDLFIGHKILQIFVKILNTNFSKQYLDVLYAPFPMPPKYLRIFKCICLKTILGCYRSLSYASSQIESC